MKRCAVCGEETRHPLWATLEHFYLWQGGMSQYLRGNIRAFGLRPGLSATIGLMCPLYNTLTTWRYRKARLVLPK